MKKNDLTIIIPTRNEEKAIGILIDKILKIDEEISILVCDDDSTDKTKEIVFSFGENVQFIDRKHSLIKGLTISVFEGLSCALTENLIVMDGDMQHPPEAIEEIYKKLKEGSDLVVASRKNKTHGLKNRKRLIFSEGGTFLGTLFLKRKGIFVKDPLTGFFGIKKDLFSKMNKKRFVFGGYKILFDILKQTPENVVVEEIFFNFDIRKNGSSKMKIKHMFHFLYSLIT